MSHAAVWGEGLPLLQCKVQMLLCDCHTGGTPWKPVYLAWSGQVGKVMGYGFIHAKEAQIR